MTDTPYRHPTFYPRIRIAWNCNRLGYFVRWDGHQTNIDPIFPSAGDADLIAECAATIELLANT